MWTSTGEEKEKWNWSKLKRMLVGESREDFVLDDVIKRAALLAVEGTERFEHAAPDPFTDSCTSVDSEEECSKEANISGSTTLERILQQARESKKLVLLYLVPRPACALTRHWAKVLSYSNADPSSTPSPTSTLTFALP